MKILNMNKVIRLKNSNKTVIRSSIGFSVARVDISRVDRCKVQ